MTQQNCRAVERIHVICESGLNPVDGYFNGPLIERFRRSVQTQQIRSLAKITSEDCVLVDQMMTKYSKFEHSQSDEVEANLPGVDELADDLKLMIDWIGEFDKRAAA
ncbi:hypothetical protein [Burkholderia anthina]|uniref:hypothetical protein n=1 Tax=Burkholderia anthina TaxID=179879 RepID=UPI00158EF68E|nr:hypothetical protein [Burkholderia anthina]